jgi:hypothetical protein
MYPEVKESKSGIQAFPVLIIAVLFMFGFLLGMLLNHSGKYFFAGLGGSTTSSEFFVAGINITFLFFI